MIECSIKTCVGCRICEVACSSIRFGAVSPSMSRIRVAKIEEAGLDLAVVCQSCAEKPCLECPTGALEVAEFGQIVLDAGLCNGCGTCVEACPIGAVGFYEGVPLFCDLCGGALECVAACPTQALSYRADHRDVSLAMYSSTGNPAERRARYCRGQGKELRLSWQSGARVDS